MNSGIDRSGRVYTLSGTNQKFIYSRDIERSEIKIRVDKIFEILDNI